MTKSFLKTKNTFYLIIINAILISNHAFCITDTIQAKSKITDVTTFFKGAQVTRKVDIKLAKGKHLLLIDKLPHEINSQSVQVEGISGCKILSVKHELKNETKKDINELEIEKKIKDQEFKVREIKNKLNVFGIEEKLLISNSDFSKKDAGTTVSEIKQAADFYRLRLNEIRTAQLNLSKDIRTANETIQELYAQINEIAAKNKKIYSQIIIVLECERDISSSLNVSYYVPTAGWEPLYDFRVEDISKPLSIVYNANIYQSSGEDWNNVNIKLSNSNPSLTGTKPELNTWYIDRKQSNPNEVLKEGEGELTGRVLDAETNEGLPFANVVVQKDKKYIGGTTTDFDGQYTIKPIQSGYYTVEVSYVGYKSSKITSVKINADKITFQDFKLSPSVNLEEIEIISYETPLISEDNTSSGAVYTKEDIQNLPTRNLNTIAARSYGVIQYDQQVKYKTQTTDYISNSLKTSVANLEYTIDIPYSIPSDGKDHNIKIKEVSTPVNYVYYAVPKLEDDAFINAEILDWTQLNLLSGNTSIYYQGTFTGESFIDVDNVSDTLTVSLGRDKNIIIKREGNKNVNDKRIIGSTIKQTIGWDITVKNNKTTGIKIIVEDQFPVSELKSIEVERLESSNAKLEDKTGKLTWEIELEPNGKKTLSYQYSVKYPKLVTISIQ